MKNIIYLITLAVSIVVAMSGCGSDKGDVSTLVNTPTRTNGIYTLELERTRGFCVYQKMDAVVSIKNWAITGDVEDEFSVSGLVDNNNAEFSVDMGNREYLYAKVTFTPMMEGTWESELYDCGGTVSEVFFQKFEM